MARFLHKAKAMPMFWNCAELCWHGNCIIADTMPTLHYMCIVCVDVVYVIYMIARQHQTPARGIWTGFSIG